jgi:hypothetical protein
MDEIEDLSRLLDGINADALRGFDVPTAAVGKAHQELQ